MKFCAKCGKELLDEASVCPECGDVFDGQGAPCSTPAQSGNESVVANGNKKVKINRKKTLVSNIVPVLFLLTGILMFVEGLDLGVPSSYLYSSSVTEYVGGDAYNYIIEASLRAGRIAAAEISKCVNVIIGLFIACISAFKLRIVRE